MTITGSKFCVLGRPNRIVVTLQLFCMGAVSNMQAACSLNQALEGQSRNLISGLISWVALLPPILPPWIPARLRLWRIIGAN